MAQPMDGDPPLLVYITAADAAEAERIADVVIAERLAACANVIAPVTSLFHWEGAVQREGEVAMVVKSRAGLIDALVERVKALHSYSCPCVVALPIVGGNPDFLEWIVRETSQLSE